MNTFIRTRVKKNQDLQFIEAIYPLSKYKFLKEIICMFDNENNTTDENVKRILKELIAK